MTKKHNIMDDMSEVLQRLAVQETLTRNIEKRFDELLTSSKKIEDSISNMYKQVTTAVTDVVAVRNLAGEHVIKISNLDGRLKSVEAQLAQSKTVWSTLLNIFNYLAPFVVPAFISALYFASQS